MIAVDTNILVYAHRRDSEWHKPAAGLLRELAESRNAWAIPWPCLHEFLAIATHPRIYSPPSTTNQAVAQVSTWLESPSLVPLTETSDYWQLLSTLLSQGKIHGPVVHDARVAAICHAHGVSELLTADRDFSRFADLKTRNPLVSS